MEANKGFYEDNKNVIIKVEPLSIAEEMGIEPGDILESINFHEIKDVFDYRFYIADDYVEVVIIKPGGEEWLLEIDKEEDEDLGIVFENGLMDNAKSCKNKCIFCFVDQLPTGMRETLYFKDDDSRLSFLQGNYVTLTNMSEEDLDRILFYKLSPINISVHATDLVVRKNMIKNPNSDKLFEYLDKILAAGIDMNFQIVLIPGVNDGGCLEKSISDLAAYLPRGQSLSVVPVGLTKFRGKLFEIAPFTPEECGQAIDIVEKWQKILFEREGTRFVFASDEFYIKSNRQFPGFAEYEDFLQIENGVGMAVSFIEEAKQAMKRPRLVKNKKKVTVVTGVAASGFIGEICENISGVFGIDINVCVVKNKFFGETITVSGLLCGCDILEALKNISVGEEVLLPQNVLRNGENVFLDNMTIDDLAEKIAARFVIVETNGAKFVETVLK